MSDCAPFLSTIALRKLCECAHKTGQIDALKRMQIPFRLSAKGKPLVTESVVDRWIERSGDLARPRARLDVVRR